MLDGGVLDAKWCQSPVASSGAGVLACATSTGRLVFYTLSVGDVCEQEESAEFQYSCASESGDNLLLSLDWSGGGLADAKVRTSCKEQHVWRMRFRCSIDLRFETLCRARFAWKLHSSSSRAFVSEAAKVKITGRQLATQIPLGWSSFRFACTCSTQLDFYIRSRGSKDCELKSMFRGRVQPHCMLATLFLYSCLVRMQQVCYLIACDTTGVDRITHTLAALLSGSIPCTLLFYQRRCR